MHCLAKDQNFRGWKSLFIQNQDVNRYRTYVIGALVQIGPRLVALLVVNYVN